MKRPTQHVFVVENGTTYAFDAVIKLEASASNKIAEEEADVNGKTHTNYAILQPETVQMEVSVSDTVTASEEPLTKGTGARSQQAFETMRAMRKRRNLLTVITPKSTYSKMLIETLVMEENADYQNEAHMTITFKEMIVAPKKKTNKTNNDQKNEEKPPESETQKPAILFDLAGIVGKLKDKLGGLLGKK